MIYTTNQLVKWLEDMRRFASKDADRATQLLELVLAGADATDRLGKITEHLDCEEAEAFAVIKRQDEQDCEIRELLNEIGLLDGDDRETRIEPILRILLV